MPRLVPHPDQLQQRPDYLQHYNLSPRDNSYAATDGPPLLGPGVDPEFGKVQLVEKVEDEKSVIVGEVRRNSTILPKVKVHNNYFRYL